jgi:hypothetical protein
MVLGALAASTHRVVTWWFVARRRRPYPQGWRPGGEGSAGDGASSAPRPGRVLVHASAILSATAWTVLVVVAVALVIPDVTVHLAVGFFMLFMGWILVTGLVVAGLMTSVGAVTSARRERSDSPWRYLVARVVLATWILWIVSAWLLTRAWLADG